MAAAEKALNTVELLETILLNLPQTDILILQRVSKTWKGVVDGSIKLQRFLFFRALESGREITAEGGYLRNWMAFDVFILDQDIAHDISKGSRRPEDEWTRKEASWRRMLLTQPPIKDIQLKFRCSSRQSEYLCYSEVENPLGIMAQDILVGCPRSSFIEEMDH